MSATLHCIPTTPPIIYRKVPRARSLRLVGARTPTGWSIDCPKLPHTCLPPICHGVLNQSLWQFPRIPPHIIRCRALLFNPLLLCTRHRSSGVRRSHLCWVCDLLSIPRQIPHGPCPSHHLTATFIHRHSPRRYPLSHKALQHCLSHPVVNTCPLVYLTSLRHHFPSRTRHLWLPDHPLLLRSTTCSTQNQ